MTRQWLTTCRDALDHFEVSDDDLIAAAQRGDQKAFVELCGRDRTEATDGSRHSYRAGFQIAIRVPSPGPTPQSCSEAIPCLCNA
jgi:hypothetical protein